MFNRFHISLSGHLSSAILNWDIKRTYTKCAHIKWHNSYHVDERNGKKCHFVRSDFGKKIKIEPILLYFSSLRLEILFSPFRFCVKWFFQILPIDILNRCVLYNLKFKGIENIFHFDTFIEDCRFQRKIHQHLSF